jgi:tetratricopeptide (TPR) repeat protein
MSMVSDFSSLGAANIANPCATERLPSPILKTSMPGSWLETLSMKSDSYKTKSTPTSGLFSSRRTSPKRNTNWAWPTGKLGWTQDAIQAFPQVIRIAPENADAHYNLGVAYTEMGRLPNGIKAYQQAVRLKPDFDQVHYNLGVVYAKLTLWQHARAAFKQAIRITPDCVEAHYNLGLMYLILGEKSAALEKCRVLKLLGRESADGLFDFMSRSTGNTGFTRGR